VEKKKDDPHLQSAQDVIGYRIHAQDGEVGHLEDMIADDEMWAIRYGVVDTRNWWPGKKVLVATDWIKGLKWEETSVTIPFLSRDQIKNSPPYDPSALVNREFETHFYDYYGRPGYWK
jgi:hypothetical protein